MITAKKHLNSIFKGIFIGAGALIPGVSGGTAAILCGEFENILYSTANIFINFKKAIRYLFPIAIGVILGVITLSYTISDFCVHFPLFSKILFCIISLISVFVFFYTKVKSKFTTRRTISILMGVIIAIVFSYILERTNLNCYEFNGVALFFIGVPLSLALVLPALSFSYMLLFFGLYDKTIQAIHNIDIFYLFPLAAGVVIGSLIFSKLLLSILKKHSGEAYSFVFGFTIFSVIDLLAR